MIANLNTTDQSFDAPSAMGQGAPLTYFYDGVLKDIFGSEILAKRDFLGFMKDVGLFLGRAEKTQGFLWPLYF